MILSTRLLLAYSSISSQPFLAQAEQEKMEYEAARRLYEEGTTGYGTNINFSILQGSPAFPTIKLESESENEA